MKRRKLIKIIAGLTGGAIIIPSGLYFATPDLKYFAEKVLYRELNYLKLDAESVTSFVNYYFKNIPHTNANSIKWKSYYYLHISSKHSSNVFELARSFLLSSDFFQYKMNTERTVKYIGPFDAYKSPVSNPYSYIFQ